MKKILLITISLFVLIAIWQNVFAVELLLEGQYPVIDGETIKSGSSLPEIIRYIYLFSLGAVGFVALLSILIGAIKYVTSADSADKAGEAKEQIKSALLGILILLAAVLILRTINPDLVSLDFSPKTLEQQQNQESEL